MDDINTTKSRLIKLNRTNYRIWLAQLKAYFKDIVKAAREDLAKNKKRPRRLAQTSDSLTKEGALETPRPTLASGAAALASLIAVYKVVDLIDNKIYARAKKEAKAEYQ